MDKVFISELKVDAVIGVYDWEKQVRQPLVFDLEMAWDIRVAAQTDDLMHALDYQAVTEYIERLYESSTFSYWNPCLNVWPMACCRNLACRG